ncbi:MAG: Uma2 family endonuclease [Planctomycetales bacterium]|nr:Uma2 family endonuclease [Planctomycetales bacterium]
MSIAASQTDLPLILGLTNTLGPHRAADYWKLPEGEPVELIQGEYVVSPAPNYTHQAISLCLSQLLHQWTKKSRGRGAAAPIDVVLSDSTILQPDLVYVSSDRRSIVQERVEGAPNLVIEIISKSHAARDRVQKLGLYAQHGVPEYWIVDPAERTVEFLLLEGDRYKIEPLTSETYTSPRLPEVSVNLRELWADVERLVNG